RERLGFNDPLGVQYVRFITGAVRGSFGESLRYKRDALGLVLERVPATLLLAGTALLLTFVIAVPLGVVSAVRRRGRFDHAAGLEAGQLLGGAVITETIFAWPGLGRLTVQALLNRDFPVVLAAVSLTSVIYTLMNLAVDLLYGWLDPRVRVRS